MKNNNLLNTVIATAGIFFVMGAIIQKSQLKDFGLSVFLVTGLVKQQKDIEEKQSQSINREALTYWQKKLSGQIKVISQSQANTNQQVQQELPSQIAAISHTLESTEQKVQQELSSQIEVLSRSLESTEQQVQQQQVNTDKSTQQLDKMVKLVKKIDDRSIAQGKQQDQARSTLDKLKHKVNNQDKSTGTFSASKKNSNHIVKFPKITAQLIDQQPTTHVYIDGNNFKCAAHKSNLNIDYRALKSYLMPSNGKIRLNFYDGVCKSSKLNRNSTHSYLRRLGYNVIALPQRNHADGTSKTIGDDVSMAIDIVETVKSGDLLILISGDGDFFPAINRIKKRQVEITAIATANSISDILKKRVDIFVDLNTIARFITNDYKSA